MTTFGLCVLTAVAVVLASMLLIAAFGYFDRPSDEPPNDGGPIRVHGAPDGDFSPDQVQDDDPYMRAMVAASMNSNGMVFGEIDENGDLHITK